MDFRSIWVDFGCMLASGKPFSSTRRKNCEKLRSEGRPGLRKSRFGAVSGSPGTSQNHKNAKNRLSKIDSFCDCLPASTLNRFRKVLGGLGEGLGRVLEALFSRFFVSVAKIAI